VIELVTALTETGEAPGKRALTSALPTLTSSALGVATNGKPLRSIEIAGGRKPAYRICLSGS
jgi:hypothetical protein